MTIPPRRRQPEGNGLVTEVPFRGWPGRGARAASLGGALGGPADLPAEWQQGVIPFHAYPTANGGTGWDPGAGVKKADVDDLWEMCAWYTPAAAPRSG